MSVMIGYLVAVDKVTVRFLQKRKHSELDNLTRKGEAGGLTRPDFKTYFTGWH